MANGYDDTDDGQDDGSWVSKLRKQNKEMKAALDAQASELAELKAKSTGRDLNRAFAQRGVNPALTKFYAGDGSDESIDVWVEENKSLLGLDKAPAEDEDSTVRASDQEAFDLLREMATSRKVVIDLESRLQEATTKEEVLAIMDEAKALGVHG